MMVLNDLTGPSTWSLAWIPYFIHSFLTLPFFFFFLFIYFFFNPILLQLAINKRLQRAWLQEEERCSAQEFFTCFSSLFLGLLSMERFISPLFWEEVGRTVVWQMIPLVWLPTLVGQREKNGPFEGGSKLDLIVPWDLTFSSWQSVFWSLSAWNATWGRDHGVCLPLIFPGQTL